MAQCPHPQKNIRVMENKQLTEKESLELISTMIKSSQQRMIDGAGKPFLIWGYLLVAVSLTILLLVRTTGNWAWTYLWFAPIVIGMPLMYLLTSKSRRSPKVTTFVDKITTLIWSIFGVTCGLVTLVATLSSLFLNQYIAIFTFIMLLLGGALLLTGIIIKFKPLVFSGIASYLIAFWMLFVTNPLDLFIIFAVAMVVVMVIPGHILNHKARK